MSDRIAALPMYDWREAQAETDAEWSRLRGALQHAGIDAPDRLVRRNADMPAVPGGIRDGSGTVIAPDPASLPPDGLDMPTLWRHPKLLLAQTCWGPMEHGLASHVGVVGQPSYDGVEGGQGEFYSSAILMRSGPGQKQGEPAPSDGRPLIPLELLRGKRLAYNSLDSMSGCIALTRDLAAMGEAFDIFPERMESGSHRASIVAVAEGRADVCAVDCKSWRLARLHEPAAAMARVVGWTGRRKGLPMITSVHTPPEIATALREILKPG